MIEPIKPNQVVDVKLSSIPEEVIGVFNALIAKKWDGSISTFTKNLAVAEILSAMSLPASQEHRIYDNNWLDVEDIYRNAGWQVTYDRPGYNEDYQAKYKFLKK